MLEQPVRLVGTALLCVLATVTLATVTFVVSNLVLSVVAVLGPVVPVADAAPDDDAVQGVLLSNGRDATGGTCRAAERDQVRSDTSRKCAGRRGPQADPRP